LFHLFTGHNNKNTDLIFFIYYSFQLITQEKFDRFHEVQN